MSKTRTLRDYRPLHDADCAARCCIHCREPWDQHVAKVFKRFSCHNYTAGSCSCGLDALLSAPDAVRETPPPVMAWQPIATAPTDGTPVLVRGRRTHTVNTATYNPDYHATRPWCDWDGRDPLPSGDEPTHWMPMPSPPTEADR